MKRILFLVEAKEQVTANLANFAYDPLNYEYLKKHNVLLIFLDLLVSCNEKLIEHGIAGICNFCLDEQVQALLFEDNHLELIQNLLDYTNKERILLPTVTILILLAETTAKPEVLSRTVLERVDALLASAEDRSRDRLRNYLLILKEKCSASLLPEGATTTCKSATSTRPPK